MPAGRPLSSLQAINRLDEPEKERIYSLLLPQRLREILGLAEHSLCNSVGERLITIIAPKGLPLVRIEARSKPDDGVVVFFLELSDTPFHQMELSFCIIRDPGSPGYAVDVDESGKNNWFASQGRNIPEELRAMRGGSVSQSDPSRAAAVCHLFPAAGTFHRFTRDADDRG